MRSYNEKVDRTITGGSSAVVVLDSTGCSTNCASSSVLDVRFELDRNRVVAWLSARVRLGAYETMLPLWRAVAL